MTGVLQSAAAAGVLLLLATTIWLCAREIRQWRTGQATISCPQFVLRLFGTTLTVALLMRILNGICDVDIESWDTLYYVKFWMNCLQLTFIIAAIAMFDLCLVIVHRRQLARHLRKAVQREFAASTKP